MRKRAIDIVISMIGLFGLEPMFLIVAVMIKFDSAGPISKVGDLIPTIENALKVVESGKPYVLNVHVQKGYAVPPPAREA